jgi:ATP-dependent RNA helicase RhlB
MPRPDKRLNMLFSATLSYRVTELAYEHMNGPTVVNVAPDKMTVDEVNQVLYHVAGDEKISLLLGLLRHTDPRRSLIFVNTKRVAEKVRAYLVGNGFPAEVLSGDVPQRKRLKLLSRFQTGELPAMVATDVAARGLHIPDVSHVFNFDLPQDPEDYVHRIGRTARAGASGDAVSLACDGYVYSLPEIEAYIGHQIPTESVTDELLVKPEPPVREPRRRPRPGGERKGAKGSREKAGSPRRRRPRSGRPGKGATESKQDG